MNVFSKKTYNLIGSLTSKISTSIKVEFVETKCKEELGKPDALN